MFIFYADHAINKFQEIELQLKKLHLRFKIHIFYMDTKHILGVVVK